MTSIPTKPGARVRYMSTQTGYETVEGIAKERADLFHMGRSTIIIKVFGFKGEANYRGGGVGAPPTGRGRVVIWIWI